MYEHLLVALDGSSAAERVLEHVEALATAFDSHITLLRATVSTEMVLAQEGAADATTGQVAPTLDPAPIIDADRDTAAAYLNTVASGLRARNLQVSTEHPAGAANLVIVERAAALGASLILMTTHGRSGIGRAIFGSTADSVLRHAACPVLLVRIPHQDEKEARSS
ncbi:MAG: universal stress protein [Chloroflexi bacterium]|nr:universal stress protein [Chloroflexota bacterium]MBV9595802.1 universal stress protein [Chloroflexota bacterium]